MPSKNFRIRLFSVALVCSLSLNAVAQQQDAISEIVVRADYRGLSVAEAPASITVLDAATINELAVQHFEELIGSLPNLNWSGDGHRAKYLQIRGVGELAQYQGAPNPSVGFVVDDIDFSGIGGIATLFDIDRIEVLRGPQGTRYGSNALAGLIYMQSTDPGDVFSGRLNLLVGDDDALGGGIALGGPLGETAGYRLSAHHYESNGFRANPYLGRDDTNGRDETSFRARLNWTAGNNWSFKLTGMLSDVDDGYDAFAIDNSLTVLSDRPGKDAQRSLGASFNIDWDGSSHFRITSVSSIVDSDIDFSFDADWGNDDAWSPITYDFISLNDRQRLALNREIRFISKEGGRLFNSTTDWILGFYVNKLDEDLTTINQGEYFDPGFSFADSLDDRLSSEFEAFSTAVFGQLEYPVGETGKLTLGARVERREVDYTDSSDLDLRPSENMVGGELSYSHIFNDRMTGFATLARGYKAGGFNLGFVPPGRREFDGESMWHVEVGLKSSFAGDRLLLSGSLFYSVRDDQQVETSFQVDPNDPASFVFFTDNAAQGRTVGLEADLRWNPNDSLEIYANLGLLNAEFDDFFTPQVSIDDRDQAHAPNYTAAIGGVYRHNSGAFARIDVSAKDDFYFDVSHDQKSQSYSVTNARIGYEAERWTVQLWLRNVFDEHYAVRGFFFGNEPPNFPPALYIRQGDPRQFGLTFDRRF
ncbi:MAG: TonB-dependent receptor [Woeseiaceae bacterium]